ncbi:TetR/AcrR family transcriptional regulator [Companilactobacillus sp. DQM5]|uniref:TetR/AcrR family transcriptional regulator n=1 Tax=Companilactobacillus sp. DQM5 TaxID=3463359 RepID=UPI004058FEE9
MTLETQKYILEVLSRELSKENVERITVKKLSQIANVSRSTLYFQFSSLNEIYSHLINKKIFDEALKKECCSELIDNLIEGFENNKNICKNLFLFTRSNIRQKFLYDRIYNYFINNCKCIKQENFNEFEKEMSLLTEYLIFNFELLLNEEVDFDQQDFGKQSRNYISYLKNSIQENVNYYKKELLNDQTSQKRRC